MERKNIKRVLLRLLCLAVAQAWGGAARAQTGNLVKIDSELQELIHQSRDANETFRVIIEMAEQYDNPNLERGTALMTRAQRRDYVVNELKRFSEQSQTEVVNYLTAQSTRGQVNMLHRFWIFNGVCCEATASCIGELSMRQDVRFVSLDKVMQMIEPIEEIGDRSNPPEGVQWHVSKVRANEVWNYPNTQGFTGAGVVIAIIDTGVNYNHVDISSKMWNGGSLYQHHGWDFYDDDDIPMDGNGHGSHVAGIVAGDGATYKTGIAPDATVMALKVFGDNHSAETPQRPTDNMLCQAIEFAVEHGADVLNISIATSGTGGIISLRQAFVNALAAGVVATVSAGNDGQYRYNYPWLSHYYPIPNNIGAPGNCPPPWHNPNQSLTGGASAVICVGNTKQNDKINSESSRGPVTWALGEDMPYNDYRYEDGSSTYIGLIRPDVSAPGTDIWSLSHNTNTDYCIKSGTSMAAPCTAGVIALMLEANPYLTPAKIDEILETTAVPCENQTSKNNNYGAGRVDAYAAVTAALNANMPHQYRISVSKYPFDCECSHVTGDSLYLQGQTCTLQASPSEYFLHWVKNGEIITGGATISFQVTEDAQYTAVFDENIACYYINVTDNPTGAAAGGSGWGHYFAGQTCTLTVTSNEGYEFNNWTKNGEVVSTEAEFSFTVSEDAIYIANFKRWCNITTEAYPAAGGTILGGGTYHSGDLCTVTATPNVGYAFIGWYNSSMWSFPYSYQPEYTFTVTQDRTLVARFAPRDYTITLNTSPTVGGSVSGGGTYPAGSMVTLTATAASGYYFNGWMENGIILTNATTYMFTATANRNLTAIFSTTMPQVFDGNVVINPDGSKGVVFYTNPMGTGGTMVALEDASEGCAWGDQTVVIAMHDYINDNPWNVLNDKNGYANTEAMLNHQGEGTGYAADVVDFEHGWYLPSANQLRKLYGALPFIEEAIEAEGGTLMTEDNYWSSTESSFLDAWDPAFGIGTAGKTSSHRVRAVRDFSNDGNFMVTLEPSDTIGGMTTGSGFFADGSQVTVEAVANSGYVFRCWREDGVEVSKDASYTFAVYSNRHLVADFVLKAASGNVVINPDGSKGVVFYTNPMGTGGTMVALEDASEGCAWGDETVIIAMHDYINDNSWNVLNDKNGYANTEAMLNHQGEGTGYAADVVDFEHGWYLPSANQLRKLYGVLPFIEEAIEAEGGTLMTENNYWSSTESTFLDAWDPAFGIGTAGKTSSHRVRAVRDFSNDGNFIVTLEPSDTIGGMTTGSGLFADGSQVTVDAVANTGYVFRCWKEDGVEVSKDASYTFAVYSNRHLVADFVPKSTSGIVVTNPDGSKGVVFYTNPMGTGGTMVALEDASEGCAWGDETDIIAMHDYINDNSRNVLNDKNGYANTEAMLNHQGEGTGYAADVVDFEHGWYLPSANQLRKLYGALPFIEEAIEAEGGTLMTEDNYWSSTESSFLDAWDPAFGIGTAGKTSSHRVRAVRDFSNDGNFIVSVTTSNSGVGSVSGAGIYASGNTITVTASPANGYVFQNWTESGVVVSSDATYTFTVYSNRNLVANFVRWGSVGTVVTNADGSKGVVFYTYPSGIGGLMVALEDVSEGCTWGLNEDITIMDNQSPSAVMDLLNDMCGKSNTNRIRQWYSGNTEFAACQTDYANGWYLPSAGQLRKLYAALPMIERAIVDAGGTTLTEDAYWSSTEQSASNAWIPSFAMNSTSKTNNCRVRAIRSLTDTKTILANVNIVGAGTVLGTGLYDYGQPCTLKAQANESYAFLNWTCGGSVVSTNMEYSFTVWGNQTYTANFVANSCNITTAMDPAGSGTVTGAGIYAIGSNCTLTATPHTGYTFVNWTKNGNVVSTQPTYSFTVTESAQYTAHFVLNSYEVIATVFPEEGGAVSGAHAYTHGSTAILTALPTEGYTFINWKENGVVVSTSPTYQFVVTGNRTLQANFSNNVYTVTAIVYPSNAGTVEGAGVYEYGTTATLTAIANNGYEFFCWFEDDDIVSFEPTVSFEVTGNREIYALFVENENITQTINLAQGWNWFSTNVEVTFDDLKEALVAAVPGTSITVKSKTKNTAYNPGSNRWKGSLNSLDVTQMYMIYLSADCEITLAGMPINPAEHPVTISNGSNWIAFPLGGSMSLSNAFAGFAVNGDKVKSRNNNSQYLRNRWNGGVTTLVPGQGYMYISNTQETRTFTFPASTR